ncbi:MAG: hypothetical protein K1X67_09095 [Fimbriimonadaceae bacterium]|nr:hypothetical protein [Fimbriimonadaceae bacterium]
MLERHLARFRRRVRWMRAWKGLAVGLAIGGSLGAVWAGLDWAGLWFTDWLWLGSLALGAALVGALVGFFAPIRPGILADSIDRRAGLENRIGTAIERSQGHDAFDPLLRSDAEQRLAGLSGSRVFPIRLGRWHGIAVLTLGLCAALFLLGNTPLLLSAKDQAERKELKEAGKSVERVIEPVEKVKNGPTPEEKRLADEYRKFARELEKGRLDKPKALQKANDLAKKAEELAKERAKTTDEQLAKAESAFDKLAKAEMEKAGIPEADPALARMSPEERAKALENAQNELDRLEKEMSDNKSLSADQKASLSQKADALRRQLKELRLSENVQKMLERMRNNPAFKELQEIAKKLAQAAQAAENGEPPELTDEDIENMKQALEELAEQLADDEAMKEYLEALKKALEEADQMGNCNGMGLGLLGMFGLGGNGGRSQDQFFSDTDRVNKLDTEAAGQGSTKTTVVSGDRREQGEESYIEIKGPASLGAKSSVPYKKVLPSYKKKAEEAMKRQDIPKEHEKRVKEYFDSLTGGR